LAQGGGNQVHHHSADKAVTIHANTNVTVQGAGASASENAREVALAQSRVYADLLRNSKAVVA